MVLFVDFAIVFMVTALLACVARFLKQPFIPVYIIAGVIIVPILNLLHSQDIVAAISELGIVLMLFVVGLELDLSRLKNVRNIAVIGGMVLAILLFFLGLGAAFLLGFTGLNPIYIGLGFAFSSTMVLIKLLGDELELDTLHGKIVLGFLIIQDVLAIVAFIALTSYGSASVSEAVLLIGKLVLMLILFLLLAKYVLPKVFSFAAKSQELLFIVAIGICFLFSYLLSYISPHAIGIGGFLAGLALANVDYNLEIIGRINPLKEFFSVLFFISLGMMLPLASITSVLVPALVLLALILFLRPIITFVIVKAFGYMPQVSFLTAITQSQVSEFGLILAFFGLSAGHVNQETFTVIILLAILSITISPYFFKYKTPLFLWSERKFRFLRSPRREEYGYKKKYRKEKPFILLVGFDRLGYSIVEGLRSMKEHFTVIDFNPEVIQQLAKEKTDCLYGDITDPELASHLKLDKCKLVISTVPERNTSLVILKTYKQFRKRGGMCFLTANTLDEAHQLYDAGADYVIVPRYIGGKHLSQLLRELKLCKKEHKRHKGQHIKELKKRLSYESRHR